MEELDNLTREDVMEIIGEGFPFNPRMRKLIITVNVDEADGELVLNNTTFSAEQYVVAVSEFIKDIEPGDKVHLDLENMMEYVEASENSYEKVGRIKITPVYHNEKAYALVDDRHVIMTETE